MKRRSDRAAFTVIEVLAIVAVAAMVTLIFLARPPGHVKAPRIKCVNNLKNIGLAFRIFATDNNDQFPAEIMLTNGVPLSGIDVLRVFLTLSNELSTPMILHCPLDSKRRQANSFTNLSLKSISYFTSLSAQETMPQAFLAGDRNLQTNGVPAGPGLVALINGVDLSWTRELHEGEGNIAMADGSVQLFNSSRLKEGLTNQSSQLGTNYLAVP